MAARGWTVHKQGVIDLRRGQALQGNQVFFAKSDFLAPDFSHVPAISPGRGVSNTAAILTRLPLPTPWWRNSESDPGETIPSGANAFVCKQELPHSKTGHYRIKKDTPKMISLSPQGCGRHAARKPYRTRKPAKER
ncbi:hypothetical protein ACQ3G6_11180 [Allorhizobium undicola]|uniref:hypothetical protein n=1 Tax=Allorhizobium undicola TaxID=78527 RepID=UPI001376D697|nr:hypothetical protein [Allorhizobium undicola]